MGYRTIGSQGIALMRWCETAVRRVPHDVECLQSAIDKRMPCTCPDREQRIARAMAAAFRHAASWRHAGRTNADFWEKMLGAFDRASVRESERSDV